MDAPRAVVIPVVMVAVVVVMAMAMTVMPVTMTVMPVTMTTMSVGGLGGIASAEGGQTEHGSYNQAGPNTFSENTSRKHD